jgi:hypothetical protein
MKIHEFLEKWHHPNAATDPTVQKLEIEYFDRFLDTEPS